MKKMLISPLEKGNFVNGGHSVLTSIADESTPSVDLLVRESIQNSLDEIRKDAEFAKVDFSMGMFQTDVLASTMPDLEPHILKCVSVTKAHFLSISDINTNGLLGMPYEREGKPNNLYNLVFHFRAADKTSAKKGGSWGIGKSVYYRYGIGLVFYYSRTYEARDYQEKLVGVLIQDETEPNCIMNDFQGKPSTGICFIGDKKRHEGKEQCWPIMDGDQIAEFLSIFGISRFKEEETGTRVIIPFIDYSSLLSNSNYKGDDIHWRSEVFEDAFEMAIQRWWFPRLNNKAYKGKRFVAHVGNKQGKVELNPFFQHLQDLYNGENNDADVYPITDPYSGTTDILGYLKVVKMTPSELGVEIPPDYYANPYAQVDVNNGSEPDNDIIFAYMRDFGLVVNYDASIIKSITTPQGLYLIALFVLNDQASTPDKSETLGAYLKSSEQPNHKMWTDIPNNKKFPKFGKGYPFKKIFKKINQTLKEKYGEKTDPSQIAGPAALRKRIGEILLPPSDFGKEPDGGNGGHGGSGGKRVSKKRPYRMVNDARKGNLLGYIFHFHLSPGKEGHAFGSIVTGGGSYTFSEWEKLGFKMPVEVAELEVLAINETKGLMSYPSNKWNSTLALASKTKGPKALEIKPDRSKTGTVKGFVVSNVSKEDVEISIRVYVRPLDLTYQIAMDGEVKDKQKEED